MGVLDGGLQAVFGAAFGGLYLDGWLHRASRTHEANGDLSTSYGDERVKVQVDRLTQGQRSAAGDSYTDKDARILVLQVGLLGPVSRPSTDDQVTAGGVRWVVSGIASDPANTYWDMRGTPA